MIFVNLNGSEWGYSNKAIFLVFIDVVFQAITDYANKFLKVRCNLSVVPISHFKHFALILFAYLTLPNNNFVLADINLYCTYQKFIFLVGLHRIHEKMVDMFAEERGD